MTEVRLNDNLSSKLIDKIFLPDSLFFDDFDSYQKSRSLMPKYNRFYLAKYTLLNFPYPKSFPREKSAIVN